MVVVVFCCTFVMIYKPVTIPLELNLHIVKKGLEKECIGHKRINAE